MVAAVLFLFLHSFRNSIIVLLSIPTSLISTFFFMYLFGYTLNILSLMALALVIGILVDDSIVVLENIHRHQENGEEPVQAAINGRSEIGFAAIAITLVDVVVFLPISLIGGMVGKIFSEFGITIVVSTLLSLFVSFTLTPLLASRWMRIIEHVKGGWMQKITDGLEAWQNRLGERYRKILAWSLDHRRTIVTISTILLLISIAFIPLGLIGTEFLSDPDRGDFAVNIDLPLGTTIEKTDQAIKKIEQIIASVPEVQRYLSTVGRQQTQWKTAEQSNVGQVQVKLIDKLKRRRGTKEVIVDIQRRIAAVPGVTSGFSMITIWGSANVAPLEIEVMGSDLTKVTQYAQHVVDVIGKTKGTVDIRSSWEEGKPEVKIQVDREKAAKLGLTLAEIGMATRTALEGDIATKYQEGDTEFDTRVVLNRESRMRSEDIQKIILINHYGQPVQLNQVANVQFGKGPTEIQRKDRVRLVTIAANLSGQVPLGQVVAAIEQTLQQEGIPTGVSVFFGGDAERMRDMFSDMTIAIGLAILFVYMIMVSLFESYVYPFTIMFSLPLALVGALAGLAITRIPLSALTTIGIVMLIGLVTKNAILLVDYTNTLRSRGLTMRDALLEAGQTRLRPIVMTTATMVFGMSPLALAIGAGSELRQGMGIVVICGLISSTLLTLVLVPVMYTYVEAGRKRLPALFARVTWAAKLPWKERPLSVREAVIEK
jgi:HAE1 family hydrophobic/amphiphilic exporter-1